MFCKNCGNEIEEKSTFCEHCGVKVDNNENATNTNVKNESNTVKSDNKVYKILSYIGFLWIVGLLSSSAKQDPKVRFHVGQGIIATICIAILYVVVEIMNNLVIANIFTDSIWGVSYVNGTGLAIMGFLDTVVSAIAIALEIIGIIHAAKDEEKELPVIGSHAFYK